MGWVRPRSSLSSNAGPQMDPQEYPSRSVLIRDLLILQMKLVIDAVKSVLFMTLARFAAICDVGLGRPGRPWLFDSVLRLGERFDLSLGLYGAASGAKESDEGLFGRSRAGSLSLP